MLSAAIATPTSDKSLIENDGYQSRISSGAERSKEVLGIQVLLQLNQTEHVLCRFVHESQLYVARTTCDDSRKRKTVYSARTLQYQQLSKQLYCRRSFRVRTCMSLDIEPEFSSSILKQHTPPLPISFSRLQFTWYRCCEMCCSKRQNEDTMREAEHVQAHTVEITLTPLEHHNNEGCRDDCTVNALLPSTDELPIANVLFAVTNVRFRISPFSSRLPRGPLRKTLPRQKYHTLSPRHGHQQHLAPIRGRSLS